MKKKIKHKKETFAAPVEEALDLDLVGFMRAIQQQLGFLEKKLDTLMAARPSPQSFSAAPQRQFGHSSRPREHQHGEYHQRIMHKATCADCGQECEVPFRPTGERPVYCKACFGKRKGGGTHTSSHQHHAAPAHQHREERRPHKKQRTISRKRKKF